jgi:hypothetical protein
MEHSTTRATDRILPLLQKVRPRGTDRWLAQCPAHEDRTPSLTIRQTDDRALIRCFAGCSAADIVSAIGLQLSDLFDDCQPTKPDPKVSRRRRAEQALEEWHQDELRRVAEELRTRDIILRQIGQCVNAGALSEEEVWPSIEYELQGYSDLQYVFEQLLENQNTLQLWRDSRL